MSDETFDYGLDPGESFDLWDETTLGPYDPHIMTVLGPIDPGDLPPTNAHATIAMLRDPASRDWIESQEHQAQALAEMEEAVAVGIGALVDLNGPMHGRNPALLRAIAEHSSMNIIPATGPHPGLTHEQALHLMIVEANVDIEEGSMLAGVISVSINDSLLESALDAHAVTGLPMVIDVGHLGLRSAFKRLQHLKAPATGIIFSGIDPLAEAAQHAVIEGGGFLLFDGLVGDRARDVEAGKAVTRLVQSGNGESILIGYNPQLRSEWLSYGGGPGWPYLVEQFPLLLLEDGLSALDVKTILVDNPNRAFVIHRPDLSEFGFE
jgi:phosphotriesterase-related protein